jgi:acyl-coenzyme A thioesterase PaaI-like protein
MPEPLNKQPNSKHCFVCGLENHHGLQLTFYEDDNGQVIAETTVPEQFQGYPGVVHGGIVAAMLDEVAGRVAMIEDPNDFKVTAKMTLRYRNQIPVGQPLKIVGQMERTGGRAARARGEIRLPDGSVGAEVEALLVDYPEAIATEAILEQLGWKVYPDEAA